MIDGMQQQLAQSHQAGFVVNGGLLPGLGATNLSVWAV